MSREIQVTFDAHDPAALSTFWRDVLGYVHPGPPGSNSPRAAIRWPRGTSSSSGPAYRWRSATRRLPSRIRTSDGPRFFFQQVPEDKVAKNRLHLDVRAAPGLEGDDRMAALELECTRLVALGATRVRRHEPEPPMSLGFIVMQDPEANEFCLD